MLRISCRQMLLGIVKANQVKGRCQANLSILQIGLLSELISGLKVLQKIPDSFPAQVASN